MLRKPRTDSGTDFLDDILEALGGSDDDFIVHRAPQTRRERCIEIESLDMWDETQRDPDPSKPTSRDIRKRLPRCYKKKRKSLLHYTQTALYIHR